MAHLTHRMDRERERVRERAKELSKRDLEALLPWDDLSKRGISSAARNASGVLQLNAGNSVEPLLFFDRA